MADITVLDEMETALDGVVGAILQKPPRYASRIISTAGGKLTGVAAAAGVTGLVGAFGTASTGTAIAGLSGAAASTATLYWIGSLVGGGVALGGAAVGGVAIGAGVLGGLGLRRAVIGKPRLESALQAHEAAIVNACLVLLKGVGEQKRAGKPPTAAEMALLADQALMPIITAVRQAMTRRSIAAAGLGSDIVPFADLLAPLALARLRRSVDQLARLVPGGHA
ncbi:MAG TPA: hypothetical protein VFO41_11825 [Alphaproteobacteria bacterium]|nr:hypothetical protein [Alphaproteobacteria bacterium]